MALEHIEKRAARIRERREDELGLTQEDVANRMHEIHAAENPDGPPDRTRGQMVSDWERAMHEPTPPKLELLARALDTTVADLNAGPIAEREPQPLGTPDPFTVAGGNGERDLQENIAKLSVWMRRLTEAVVPLLEKAEADQLQQLADSAQLQAEAPLEAQNSQGD